MLSSKRSAHMLASSCILVVEDHEISQRMAKIMLSTLGCNDPDIASNGQSALDLFQTGLHTSPYDLVFMDIGLPDMEGTQVTEQIRAMEQLSGRQRTPIIALTTHCIEDAKLAFVQAGIDGLIAKPVSLKIASKIIHTILNVDMCEQNRMFIDVNYLDKMHNHTHEQSHLQKALTC